MRIEAFFTTWPGMYLAQSFIHALVAALIVDTALLAWNIENPRVRQRFRLMVIILPLVTFPLYQALAPERGTALFRLDAVLDMNRWLNLEMWGAVPLGILFLLLLGFTGMLFIVQELLPIIRHTASTRQGALDATTPEPSSAVARALAGIPGTTPKVFVLNDQEVLMFSSTGSDPAIYLSPGVVRAFTEDELRAAIAHEIGHIRRSRRPVMILVYLVRVILLLNPVILMEFRRFIQEEEKICDDVAVELTGNREAMAGALRKFFDNSGTGDPPSAHEPRGVQDRIEEYGHTLLIENRIERLESASPPEANGAVVFGFTLAAVMGICFYVV
jgi:Zn-dependent protease with chaperone function